MKTMRNVAVSVVATAVLLGLGGCSGMSKRDESTAIGAGVGAVGGAPDYPDGIWASVAPEAFLLPNDYMLSFNNYDAASGRWALDFNVTPILGTAVEGPEGELFNFEVTFAQPGTVQLGFEQFRDVDRAYYSYAESYLGTVHEYYWGDISNDHAGVANTIEVTE